MPKPITNLLMLLEHYTSLSSSGAGLNSIKFDYFFKNQKAIAAQDAITLYKIIFQMILAKKEAEIPITEKIENKIKSLNLF